MALTTTAAAGSHARNPELWAAIAEAVQAGEETTYTTGEQVLEGDVVDYNQDAGWVDAVEGSKVKVHDLEHNVSTVKARKLTLVRHTHECTGSCT